MVDLVAPLACAAEDADVAGQLLDERLDPLLGQVGVLGEVGDPERDLRPGRGDEVAEDLAGDVLLALRQRRERGVEVRAHDLLRAAQIIERLQAQEPWLVSPWASQRRCSSSQRRSSTSWRYGATIPLRGALRERGRARAGFGERDSAGGHLVEHGLDERRPRPHLLSGRSARLQRSRGRTIASRAASRSRWSIRSRWSSSPGTWPLKRSSFASESSRIESRKWTAGLRRAQRRCELVERGVAGAVVVEEELLELVEHEQERPLDPLRPGLEDVGQRPLRRLARELGRDPAGGGGDRVLQGRERIVEAPGREDDRQQPRDAEVGDVAARLVARAGAGGRRAGPSSCPRRSSRRAP